MADLFSTEIDAIKLTDVDDFLALNRSELERPPEGTRLDYKELLPSDIGETVAAFANTDGGLIFVGVDADKKKQNIPVARNGTELGTDAKARITNIVLSTVRPRPPFEVTVLTLDAPSKNLAVIRVQTGPYPPYEFSSGAKIKIPVRIQDSNRQASLRQIEDLQRRRAVMSAPAENVVGKYGGPTPGDSGDLYLTGPGGEREREFQLALIIPRVPTNTRMDSALHREFERLIRIAFTRDTQFNRYFSKGRFFQVEQRSFEKQKINRGWRIWGDGAIAMVESLVRRGNPATPVEWLGDFALSLLQFFKLTNLCLERWNGVGPVIVFHFLSGSSTQFLPHFPKAFDPENPHVVQGIHFPKPDVVFLQGSSFYQETDVASLRIPQELTAEIVLHQFQEVFGASIRFEDLLFAAKRMFADFGLANLSP